MSNDPLAITRHPALFAAQKVADMLQSYEAFEVGAGSATDANGEPVPYDRNLNDLVDPDAVWVPCLEGYPAVHAGALVVNGVFGPEQANFRHTEHGIRATHKRTGAVTLLQRVPGKFGTKEGGEWHVRMEYQP